MFGDGPLRHCFLFGRGMISDDTEHACMTAQALLRADGDTDVFARSLAWRLRGWLLGLPAGTGLATGRAIIKLWCGFPPSRSGVYSAGNGPAMRAPIIGVYARDNADLLNQLVRASTRLTHTDPRAEEGALAVALAAAYGARHGAAGVSCGGEFLEELRRQVTGTELCGHLETAREALKRGASVAEFAQKLGLERGVSGYINHTVPVALYAWLRHATEFRTALESVIVLGGDTDTVGAIVGALSGATLGTNAIPTEWVAGIVEWPRSVRWMERLAARFELASESQRPLPLFWPGLAPRNAFFLAAVLAHGFRRLLPPY
jgi:ADP-ribosylglycohydrolase